MSIRRIFKSLLSVLLFKSGQQVDRRPAAEWKPTVIPYAVVEAAGVDDALANANVNIGDIHGNKYVSSISVEQIQGTSTWWVYCKYEPKYRPFANAEEFKPHHKRLIRCRDVPNHYHVVTWFNDFGCFRDGATYTDLLSYWVFDDDGSPCGVPE